MGVPAFYRWLVTKYPNIVVKAIVNDDNKSDGVAEEDATASPTNPNGEFDNFYLDMNGIIHPCFHPDDQIVPPTTYEEVFTSIHEYIDRLLRIVRPRKLLYMAIDGVAPRAKMNQQRSRRFRAAKDFELAEEVENSLRKKFADEGKPVHPNVEWEKIDSNVITPGTKFLYELSKSLRIYIRDRMKNDAGWKNIKVILSDANVPGEGEHKIMSFIRLQRSLENYDPNTRHCLHGLDADLIMLALATHELHFSILREDVLKQQQQLSSQSVRPSIASVPNSTDSTGFFEKVKENSNLIKQPYEFMNIWILREYLELDMAICDLPKDWKDLDFERIVDDFVFLCFFAGNDFLPHLPTLDIHEGAIDLLMTVYKEKFKNLGGYLVDMERIETKNAGYIELKRVEKFILFVGKYEEAIFKKRSEVLERKRRRILNELLDDAEEETSGENVVDIKISSVEENLGANDVDREISAVENDTSTSGTKCLQVYNNSDEVLRNTKELKSLVRESIRQKADLYKNGLFSDKVRLGLHGWKERYYKDKFSAETPQDIDNVRKSIVQWYTEGLCWVLLYYFSGVPSWTWFYPYHYGPFASDLKGLGKVKVMFQKGARFQPFDQLMAVLPPRSAHALPEAFRTLMTDKTSSIIGFYPSDFDVDANGKRFLWQGICKLPFIEENQLLTETRKLEDKLEDNEKSRNAAGCDWLFVRGTSELGKFIMSDVHKDFKNLNASIKIDNSLSDGIGGFIYLCDMDSETSSRIFPNNMQVDDVLCVFYQLPPDARPHIPRVLTHVTFPEKTICEEDIQPTELWHEYQGNRPNTRSYQERNRNAAASQYWKSNKAAAGYDRKSASTSSDDVPIYYQDGSTGGWRGRGRVNSDWSSRGRGNPSPFRISVQANPTGRARPHYDAGGMGRAGPSLSFAASGRASTQADNTGFDKLKISEHGHSPMPPRSFHPRPIGYSSYRPLNATDYNSNYVCQLNPCPGSRPPGRFHPAATATSSWRPRNDMYNDHNAWEPRPWRAPAPSTQQPQACSPSSAISSQTHHTYVTAGQARGSRLPATTSQSQRNGLWAGAGNSQPHHAYATTAVQARGSRLPVPYAQSLQNGPWAGARNLQAHHSYASATQAPSSRPPAPFSQSQQNGSWGGAGNSQMHQSYASAVQARGSGQYAPRNASPTGRSNCWFPNNAETRDGR